MYQKHPTDILNLDPSARHRKHKKGTVREGLYVFGGINEDSLTTNKVFLIDTSIFGLTQSPTLGKKWPFIQLANRQNLDSITAAICYLAKT